VDLEIAGRRAIVIGADDDPVVAACERLLSAEGAEVVAADDREATIVIVAGSRRPRSTLLEGTGVDDLYSAWDEAVDTITEYRATAERMTTGGWGRLVWIGSAQAKSVDAEQDELGAVVSLGMLGLHKVVTSELGPGGVTANAVLRGGDATDEDVAAAAVFLCSAGAGFLSGITMVVDGGAGSGVF